MCRRKVIPLLEERLTARILVLLYIHRQFFTKVMTENPNNPLDSPYAASVLATFRCAVTVLQVVFFLPPRYRTQN